ncbi:MAG: hypothetical protein J6S85_02140 [Methanobrevibacter sp.]|nr:hypothetical protein [Methanobrevibacter sp.]MBO7712337.1 hypothetical protein [Methanobrevibacter sp.]
MEKRLKIYIYRPDMAKINPNLLFTPRGNPYFESRDREKELRDKCDELRDELELKKRKPFKIIY